ncbi:MAG: hypothetical protein VKL59_17610 [Nostocaceae cyanobacterium]|nr:hypothetical protein [Nostocaceae cyanobacterium]
MISDYPAFPQYLTDQPSSPSQRAVCTDRDFEILITKMLRDLPGYTNRVTQRARRLDDKSNIFSYMIVAGRPEFKPLPLNLGSSLPQTSANNNDDVKQVFFTTLERQYTSGKIVQLQQFHWLFLTRTDRGWQLVMMFSQTGFGSTNPINQPPTPPRDSSNGTIAQAINTWLLNCNAGSVRINVDNYHQMN